VLLQEIFLLPEACSKYN